MQYTKESVIVTIDDVREFFNHLVNERQVVFHPDDPFEDYKFGNGHRVFTQEECVVYNRLMDESFDVCEDYGTDIYTLGFDALQGNLIL